MNVVDSVPIECITLYSENDTLKYICILMTMVVTHMQNIFIPMIRTNLFSNFT